MARKVFFSFYFDDVLKVNVVRKSDVVTRQYTGAVRFYDKSLWEETQKQGDLAIKRLINKGLDGSGVTCVLVGQHTWSRPWVRYELLKSFERGNGILAINIHDVGIEKKKPSGVAGRGLLGAGASILTGALSGAGTIPAPSFGNALAGLAASKKEPPTRGLLGGLRGQGAASKILTGSTPPPRSGLAGILAGYDLEKKDTPLSSFLGSFPPPKKETPLANALGAINQPSGSALRKSALASFLGSTPGPATNLLTGALPTATPGLNPLDYVGFAVNHLTGKVELIEHFALGRWRRNPHISPMPLAEVVYPLGPYPTTGKFSNLFPIYNWKSDNGAANFPTWVEAAALQAGR